MPRYNIEHLKANRGICPLRNGSCYWFWGIPLMQLWDYKLCHGKWGQLTGSQHVNNGLSGMLLFYSVFVNFQDTISSRIFGVGK